MNITFNNFLSKYLLDPTSPDLYLHQKIGACFLSGLSQIVTLGGATALAYALKEKRAKKLQEVQENHKRFAEIAQSSKEIFKNTLENINNQDLVEPISQKDVSLHVQNFVKDNYTQPLPSEKEVMVPNKLPNGEKFVSSQEDKIHWSSLTQEEKVKYYNHFAFSDKKLPENLIGETIVDRMFFALNGQKPYLESDPREHHGADHCVRTAIFSAIFAYLYAKYHPNYSPEEVKKLIPIIQIVAAGHDSQRQSEGVDVYDPWSAENTVDYLIKLGIEDIELLVECQKAIECKDDKDLQNKHLIGKCVQNSDCAEYARLWLWSTKQDDKQFKESCKYLDIFTELGADEAQFKDGFTKEDFMKELNAIRLEMNQLIYYTHKKGTREKLANSENYYNKVLGLITQARYPLLNHILKDLKILNEPKIKSALEKEVLTSAKELLNQGLKFIPNKIISEQINELKNLEEGEERNVLIGALTFEINIRKIEKTALKLALQNIQLNCNNQEKVILLVVSQYAALSPLTRDKMRAQVLNFLKSMPNWQEIGLPQGVKNAVLIDLMQNDFKNHIKISTDPIQICNSASEMADLYNATIQEYRDPRIQTTLASAYKKAAQIYLDAKMMEEYRKTLKEATLKLQIDESNVLFNLDKFDLAHKPAVYLKKGDGSIRNRNLRVAEKMIENEAYVEFSFELNEDARRQLEQTIEKDTVLEASKKEYLANKKDFADGTYSKTQGKSLGDAHAIQHQNYEIFVGSTKSSYNTYHLVRIRVKKQDHNIQSLQTALCSIGLPGILLESDEDTLRKEALSKILAFRFPHLAYQSVGKEQPTQDPEMLYQKLTKEQKKVVDEDLKNVRLKRVGPNDFEFVNPKLAEEAWKMGGRGLISFINGGESVRDTAQTLGFILNEGFLSTEEREARGIVGVGCVPCLNYMDWIGSKRAVYSRTLTKNFFENEVNMKDFAITGPIMILLDNQAFERMPYSYPCDRGGMTNPDFSFPIYAPEGQMPKLNIKGNEVLAEERCSFREIFTKQTQKHHFTAETIFENTLGSQYIKKVVVWNEEIKFQTCEVLEKMGIHHINGVPLKDAIIVSDHLKPEMIDNFKSPNPYLKDSFHDKSLQILSESCGFGVDSIGLSKGPELGQQTFADLRILSHVEDTFEWKKKLIASAEKSIELSANYAGGKGFREILSIIMKRMAEKPDLQVHLICSNEFLESEDRKLLEKLSENPNFHCLINHPIIDIMGLKTSENHVKLLVVDEKYFVLGGSAITQGQLRESIPKDDDMPGFINNYIMPKAFRDANVAGEGIVAERMRMEFFKLYNYWENLVNGCIRADYFPIEGEKGINEEFEQSPGLIKQAKVKFHVGGPEHGKNNPITNAYLNLINSAQSTIRVANMQFNPDPRILEALNKKKGEDVFTVGQFNTHIFSMVYPARSNYDCFHMITEYDNGQTYFHEKVIVADDQRFIIGSYNMSRKSAFFDHEIALEVEDKNCALEIVDELNKDINSSAKYENKNDISTKIDKVLGKVIGNFTMDLT